MSAIVPVVYYKGKPSKSRTARAIIATGIKDKQEALAKLKECFATLKDGVNYHVSQHDIDNAFYDPSKRKIGRGGNKRRKINKAGVIAPILEEHYPTLVNVNYARVLKLAQEEMAKYPPRSQHPITMHDVTNCAFGLRQARLHKPQPPISKPSQVPFVSCIVADIIKGYGREVTSDDYAQIVVIARKRFAEYPINKRPKRLDRDVVGKIVSYLRQRNKRTALVVHQVKPQPVQVISDGYDAKDLLTVKGLLQVFDYDYAQVRDMINLIEKLRED